MFIFQLSGKLLSRDEKQSINGKADFYLCRCHHLACHMHHWIDKTVIIYTYVTYHLFASRIAEHLNINRSRISRFCPEMHLAIHLVLVSNQSTVSGIQLNCTDLCGNKDELLLPVPNLVKISTEQVHFSLREWSGKVK